MKSDGVAGICGISAEESGAAPEDSEKGILSFHINKGAIGRNARAIAA